jgi:hypothetical protein
MQQSNKIMRLSANQFVKHVLRGTEFDAPTATRCHKSACHNLTYLLSYNADWSRERHFAETASQGSGMELDSSWNMVQSLQIGYLFTMLGRGHHVGRHANEWHRGCAVVALCEGA